MTRGRADGLTDRRGERDALDRLVAAVRGGQSRALVMRGDPGVGKTALLDYLARRAWGCQVARASGVQSEMELAFAGLHQLCAPMLSRAEHLPVPQRDALRTASISRSSLSRLLRLSVSPAAGPRVTGDLPGPAGCAKPHRLPAN